MQIRKREKIDEIVNEQQQKRKINKKRRVNDYKKTQQENKIIMVCEVKEKLDVFWAAAHQ